MSGQALADKWLTQAACLLLNKRESWHHNLKTFILDEVDQEKREKRIASQPWP